MYPDSILGLIPLFAGAELDTVARDARNTKWKIYVRFLVVSAAEWNRGSFLSQMWPLTILLKQIGLGFGHRGHTKDTAYHQMISSEITLSEREAATVQSM